MLAVIAKIPFQDGKLDEAVEVVKKYMAGTVKREEGTLYYTINSDKSNPNLLVVIERYKDKEALQAHSGSPQFQEMFGKLGGLLGGEPEITVYRELDSI